MAGAEMRRSTALDEVRAFLVEEVNCEPVFYSSGISQRRSDSCRTVSFDCVLKRRRRELVDASLILEIASVEVLVGVVTTLVNCSTWTMAKFQFGCCGLDTREESSDLAVFERRMLEVFHLHRSSPSLLCLDVSGNVRFWELAETVAGVVSPNSALKSLSLHTSHISSFSVDQNLLEVLFTSASMISVKELVLRFPDCMAWNNCTTVVKLARWNTTFEKLTLYSIEPWSSLKSVTYTWTSENHGRALQVKYSSKTAMFFSVGLIEPLTANFSLVNHPDGILPGGTDLSTLHLRLSLDHSMMLCNHNPRPEDMQTFRKNMLLLVTSVASMSARSTTLRHVQMSFEWGRQLNDKMCSCRKQVELLTQDKLRKMVENELRGNTSLETLEVGYWKLIRRGRHVSGRTDEWHTSYGGACLRESTLSNEYVVEVQM